MEKLIAITPSHCLDPKIAIAACRAQGLGILDLGYRNDPTPLTSLIDRLAAACTDHAGRWGVRWDTLGLPQRGLDRLAQILLRPVPVLVLAGLGPADWAMLRKQTKRLARQLLIEVHDLPTARAAAAHCDGLIVKGHEAGGFVSRHAAFVLLQEFSGQLTIPYWIQGGIGLHSAPTAMLAGATGVVLGEQLWLAAESPLAQSDSSRTWRQLDGSETILLGPEETPFRLFGRAGRDKLRELEQRVTRGDPWREELAFHLAEADNPLLPLGQDIAFASGLAKRYGTVGRILTALQGAMDSAAELARSQQALAENSPLAKEHGTRFPIVQGPMTRVSDTLQFVRAVAKGGGLPFLALSVMRKPQVHTLLTRTKALLGNQSWGVGVLGFMPLELRQEQLDVIREVKPPFAIIAGGRPSQARELEALSITTYLHVPSPGLLHGFIKEGARKFIFEGSECGGHTGPRTSFILWESAIEVLTTVEIDDPESVHILFAGGIHDELSAAMVSVMAAPLVARGMKIGVVMGTAYLFTKEIVGTGAIVNEFQAQAVACQETALLQSGVGVYTRCAKTPFCDEFNRTRRELLLALESEERTLKVLELLNIGRLRIASKGISHNSQAAAEDGSDRYVKVDLQTQRQEGMYMLGEVARLKSQTLTIVELHAAVAAGSQSLLARRTAKRPDTKRILRRAAREDIAIIGMACVLPKAENYGEYWQNIIRQVNAIREVSDDRWRPDDLFDPKRGTPDKTYSKWGGFLDDVQFDPTAYGIPPASLRSIEPMQLLALAVAKAALEDAGLDRHPFPRDRTATIFASGGMNDLGTIYIFRTLLAHYLPKVPDLPITTQKQILRSLYDEELPPWTEDSFPGFLGNVVAGRVANRLNLGGTNFAVDAACASSLAALDVGIRQLRSGDADVALVGAIDGTNNAVAFMAFAQTHALSPRGRCRPFDDSADGIAIGEGVASLVLKRLSDAERDGDRIYAVIKGIGGSSDGRNRSLTAPHPQGQVRALKRAYEDAGVDLATVGLIEAHGTGTAVGDKSEIESLNVAFGNADSATQNCAVGSVKSMIGHTKVTAGLASVVKTALALKHRVLPPTLGVEVPNSRVDFTRTPFYINTEARPWLSGLEGHPRRAGVSAFGFGGTNFHTVLEEYTGGYRDEDSVDLNPRDAEPFVWHGSERSRIVQAIEDLLRGIEHPEYLNLAQLAYSVHREQHRAAGGDAGVPVCRLALLATSVGDLRQKLELALRELRGSDKTEFKYPQGLSYREGAPAGKLCFVFPGQGSQKVNMLRDLIVALPRFHALFRRSDELLDGRYPKPLSQFIYPLPVFNDEDRSRQQTELNATHIAQPALGTVELAALELLGLYGIRPDFAAGHSYGEYVALCAAGVLGSDDLIRLSEIRGRIAAEVGQRNPGAMAAVDAGGERVQELIDRHELGVTIANLNTPDQTIIAGSPEAVDAAATLLSGEALRVTKLQVTGAFHCSKMADACERLAAELARIEFREPRFPVFSNTTAEPYPTAAETARALLARHLAEPVRFVEEVGRLYEAGARIFVEVGPGLVVSGLIDRILGDRPHLALGVDVPGRPGWLQLGHCLAQLFTQGVPVQFQAWFKGRGLKDASVAEVLAQARAKANPGPLIWRINGGRAEPWHAPAAGAKNIVPLTAASKSQATAAPAATVQPVAATRPSLTVIPQSPANIRRYSTMTHEASGSGGATSLGEGGTASADPKIALIQSSVAQLIELQREQQRTLCSFMDFLQTNLLGAAVPEQREAVASSAAAESAATLQEAAAGARRAVVGTVPPAPVLPLQVRTGGSTAPKPVSAVPTPPSAPAEPALAPIHRSGEGASPRQAAAAPAGGLAPTAQFKADLLRAVAERTGYPEEMLDLDAHMEADLGIDSIKRIETFSALKDSHNLLEGRDEETVLEELSGLKTLNEIIAWYDRLRETSHPEGGANPPKKAQTPPSFSPVETVESETKPALLDNVRGYVLKAVAAPWDQPAAASRCPLPMLVLGPSFEATEAFCRALADDGYPPWRLVPGPETRAVGEDRYEADFTSGSVADDLRELIRKTGKTVGGLVSLLGLGGDVEALPADPPPAKILFLALKALERDLREGAPVGGGRLVNLTALDGRFGLGGSTLFSVAGAGTLGMAKSAAREWPHLRVKCIDLDPALDPSDWTGRALEELRHEDPNLEIGFSLEGRWRLNLESWAPQRGAGLSSLAPGAVLLATGGAHGITADIALALAQESGLRLVLVGRSSLPEPESPRTAALTDPDVLRKALIEELKAAHGKVKPTEVEAKLKQILKERQIRANLNAFREAGAEIEYHALDVRDGEAFGRLIDDIYARWGRIDGVLHGAGIIEDKLIRDKSPDSFDTVYRTKVVPAEVLARKLWPEGLKFLVFFSSIAGRFGNVGQCDYSAGNEVLNKLADRLAVAWPGVHTVSINWGPWDAGMVTEELRRLYASRNIQPIPVETGIRYCLDVLEGGARGEPELLITASLEQIAALGRAKPKDSPSPQGNDLKTALRKTAG